MTWGEFIASAVHELGAVLRDDRSARMAALSGLSALMVMTFAKVAIARVRGRKRAAHGAAFDFPVDDGTDLGDWGLGGVPSCGKESPISSAGRWPIDRVLPRRIGGTIAVAVVAAIGIWLAGLSLAPVIPAFLTSPEWQAQPIYIAGHIIAVRLFVHVYARGFEGGVAKLAAPPAEARALVHCVLGFPGALVALVAALPFVALDFLYLFSDRYEPMGGPDTVLPIDYLMWGIWSVEWFLNAFIWVVLLGFLIKTSWVVRRYPFRAPIEIVLHDKHYKPFLQMSAQGATIVLAFTLLTILYIRYSGGELTDYVGLGITALLLVVGFLPPWLLLRAKVRRAVEDETLAMRGRLLRDLELAETGAGAAIVDGQPRPAADARTLEHRLDAAVAILRISYLENRYQSLGAAEARAVLVRLLAPAASVGWQVAKSYESLLSDLQLYLGKVF